MTQYTIEQNVFVLGLDDFNRGILDSIADESGACFHSLLSFEEAKGFGRRTFDDLLAEADRRLRQFDDGIDAITAFWDFPVSSMLPVLCARFGVPGPRLSSVLKCEHKYWSRLLQAEVTDAHPAFQVLNPHDDDAAERVKIDYPFFVKPIKSTSSALAFKVEDHEQWHAALSELRTGIQRIAEPFDQLIQHLEYVPQSVRDATGCCCLVESIMSGAQCTVCGYVQAREARVYGVVDSLTYEDSSTFESFVYPSSLPHHLVKRLSEISCRVMEHIGFSNGCFNIEFFVDTDSEQIALLEINPRISQSHTLLFDYVDGVPNLRVMTDVALGRAPDRMLGQGAHKQAAKWMWRHRGDAWVQRVPAADEIAAIEQDYDAVRIKVLPRVRSYLSDLLEQDPYAYDLAYIWVGGNDQQQLRQIYEDTTVPTLLEQ